MVKGWYIVYVIIELSKEVDFVDVLFVIIFFFDV